MILEYTIYLHDVMLACRISYTTSLDVTTENGRMCDSHFVRESRAYRFFEVTRYSLIKIASC